MIVNLNIRKTTDGGLFVQYQEDGRAKDAVFITWRDFIFWLERATVNQ